MKKSGLIKRLICLCVTLAMVLTLFSVSDIKAEEAEVRPATKVVLGTADGTGVELNASTPIYLRGGTAVEDFVPDGVHPAYLDFTDSAKPVLHINGLQIEGYYVDPLQEGLAYALYADGDLNVVLHGTNIITNNCVEEAQVYGMWVSGMLEFSDDSDGSLVCTAKSGQSSYGIESMGLTVKNGIIEGRSEQGATSFGVRSSGDINVVGGTLRGFSGDIMDSSYSIGYGIYASGKFSQDKGVVEGYGGNASDDLTSFSDSVGIYTSEVVVAGGTMTGTAGEASNKSIGIDIYSDVVTDFVVSGGSVFANGGKVNDYILEGEDAARVGTSYGLVNYNGNVIINGGELVAKGGPTKESKGDSSGIYYGKSLNINDGRVLVSAHAEALGRYAFTTMEGDLPVLTAGKYRYKLAPELDFVTITDGTKIEAWYSDYTEIICGEEIAQPTNEPNIEPSVTPTNTPKPQVAKVKKVKFVKKTVKVKKGRTATLKVKLSPVNGLSKAAKNVKWSIDKKGKKVVKFTKKVKQLNGKLTVKIKAIKKGKAKVTCKAPSGKNAVCKVIVK